MLYSLIAAVLLLSFFMPFMAVWCFYKGYNLRAREEGKPEAKMPRIKRKIKMNDQQKKAAEEWQKGVELFNKINNYEG